MALQKLKEFLDQHSIRYVLIIHSPAYTAQEVAASVHIAGKELAKTVMVKLDGQMAMVVLPAAYQIDFDKLKQGSGADEVQLATEEEFKDLFPGCEVGAMPPFGNLFDIQVFADEILKEDEEIAFNSGSHTELMRINFKDFERLVNPKFLDFKVQR